MRLWGVALVCATMACEEDKKVELDTGKGACEASGGEWSSFKTKQGLLAEICCHPPAETVATKFASRDKFVLSRSAGF